MYLDRNPAGAGTQGIGMDACANPVVEALCRLLLLRVCGGGDWGTSTVCVMLQAALHALSQLLRNVAGVARCLSCETLRLLLECFLCCPLHPRLAPVEEEGGEEVAQNCGSDEQWMAATLDGLLWHVLNKGLPNRVLAVLISFLYQSESVNGSDGPGAKQDSVLAFLTATKSSEAFLDGVLECLMNMTRLLGDYVDELDVDMLLLDIHNFLTQHPPSAYRGAEFKPLRLLKTMINELVALKGPAIAQHLTLVPVDSNPTLCR
jgi:hypothetical protein